MVRRSFEMHQYRQALLRMRQGDSDRQIAAARVMGRPKAAQLRELAQEQGWLAPEQALPKDEAIAAALGKQRRPASTVSSLGNHRTRIVEWAQTGISGVAIHAVLKREHGFSGSYSAVRRMLADIGCNEPVDVTCRLDFEPGEAARIPRPGWRPSRARQAPEASTRPQIPLTKQETGEIRQVNTVSKYVDQEMGLVQQGFDLASNQMAATARLMENNQVNAAWWLHQRAAKRVQAAA
jgi:hypothetical protein